MKNFILRHRISLKDLGFVALAGLVSAYVLLQVDVFIAENEAEQVNTIEANELPLLGAVLCLGLLLFAWRRLREQKRETRRRVEAERHARELAFQDPLTGLPNRRQFMDALAAAVAAPPRTSGTHVLMMLDLNGFKQINDVYGHGAGDAALIVVGERLMSSVRSGDMVARLGGDEFAILAQHLSSAETATGITRRVHENLAVPITISGTNYNVGTGIGLCLFPFRDCTPQEIMRRADVALYRAKANRQQPTRFFDEEMDHYVRERDFMERELREAVAANAIRPSFQPLIKLKIRRIVGFEVFARWTHATLGEVPPERFIAIAEDAGLIQDLTDRLLRQACAAACGWPAEMTLSFNVSPVQLRDPALGLRILGILAETGLAPRRLEIEITESALVHDLAAAQEALSGLREAGVRIALDDFGTGYSSLYHLRNFKLDKIKIDRSFIEGMSNERESAEIVNALVGLGRGLGLAVTADGIERPDQEAQLADKGCEEGQGHLFGAAMTAEEADKLVAGGLPAQVSA